MQAQITKLHHRPHKEQGKHSIIWYEVTRDIMIVWKFGMKLLVAIFIQGKNISRNLCIHKNILSWTIIIEIFSVKNFLNYGSWFFEVINSTIFMDVIDLWNLSSQPIRVAHLSPRKWSFVKTKLWKN